MAMAGASSSSTSSSLSSRAIFSQNLSRIPSQRSHARLSLPPCRVRLTSTSVPSWQHRPWFTLRAAQADAKNINEELDEDEMDELFEKHGEVVIADSNPRPASAEVDDDSQSLLLAIALAEAANDIKAVDILVLHVKPLIYWTQFFVIATAFSRPQLAAIAKKMRDVSDERFKVQPRGDSKPTSWTLLDYGDVVVHVFLPKERAFYNLEEFYGNAPVVELSFNASDKVTSSD